VFLLSELNFHHCYECGLNIVSGEGAFRPAVFALQQGSELAFPRLVYLTNAAVTVHCTRDEGCYSDLLRAERSGDRIPVGERFSAPVQTDPGAHPSSCTMGTGCLSRG
jgi:hypothetical protein